MTARVISVTLDNNTLIPHAESSTRMANAKDRDPDSLEPLDLQTQYFVHPNLHAILPTTEPLHGSGKSRIFTQ